MPMNQALSMEQRGRVGPLSAETTTTGDEYKKMIIYDSHPTHLPLLSLVGLCYFMH